MVVSPNDMVAHEELKIAGRIRGLEYEIDECLKEHSGDNQVLFHLDSYLAKNYKPQLEKLLYKYRRAGFVNVSLERPEFDSYIRFVRRGGFL